MFTITNKELDINYIYYQEKKYGLNIHKQKSFNFTWIESINDFLAVCGYSIDSFINDCILDSYEELSELEIEYLYELNFPSSLTLVREYPDLLCDLLYKHHNLMILSPYFNNKCYNWNNNIFIINPIQSISIKQNEMHIYGMGYFLKK